MSEQEYTPTEARLRERVKGSLGEYAHEFGIDGEAAMDAWIDQALAERDNRVRADERAKRPDREQIAKALFEVRDDPYDDDRWEDLDSQQRERWECDADAVLALEPEAREELKLSGILARAEEVRQDDGWCIGGAWGDYGEVVVPIRLDFTRDTTFAELPRSRAAIEAGVLLGLGDGA